MVEHKSKRNFGLFIGGFAVGALVVLAFLYSFAPQFLPLPQQKPQAPAKSPYEYYIILDEATGATMMYVSVVTVNPGDEMITEENKRYVITRVEENRAYARYVEDVNIRTKKEAVP
jgi:hypothetical protein